MVANWHEKRGGMSYLERGADAMVRGKLTFISGGVRSGKSAYAEKLLVDEAQTKRRPACLYRIRHRNGLRNAGTY